MATRITAKTLELLVRTLNHTMGTPAETAILTPGQPPKWQIGNYHIEATGNGYSLNQISNDAGGVYAVSFAPKAYEMYMFLQGMLASVYALKREKAPSDTTFSVDVRWVLYRMERETLPEVRQAIKDLASIVDDLGATASQRTNAKELAKALHRCIRK